MVVLGWLLCVVVSAFGNYYEDLNKSILQLQPVESEKEINVSLTFLYSIFGIKLFSHRQLVCLIDDVVLT